MPRDLREDDVTTTLNDIIESVDTLSAQLEAFPTTGEMFAAMAMQGLLMNQHMPPMFDATEVAKTAWDLAEALMSEQDRRAELQERIERKQERPPE
jgi:hypothetical protein